ncbi:hypothetical protein KIW84_010809 [Lathyrus oleraceus]|uniref:Uncharacterized protein n=1 Tax=Pisum sativum TaxID=3888 RepID=A0A9D5BEB2_PEA|nr:hypothetical protein KIW84_010809 [Pisum sativum]
MKLCMVCTCSTFHIVCRPKKEGGLGVKHCRRFNLALLSKWKWCILNKNNSIWHEFLGFRYEDLASLVLQGQVFLARAKVSLWWKDLCSVGKDVQLEPWWDDRFVGWRNNGGFSVSASYYRLVDVESGGAVLEANKLWLLEFVWKTKTHSKLVFGLVRGVSSYSGSLATSLLDFIDGAGNVIVFNGDILNKMGTNMKIFSLSSSVVVFSSYNFDKCS